MNVLLADARAQVRWALRTFLKEELGMTVVAEAADSDALLSKAFSQQPDLIFLEWELPGLPIEEILDALTHQHGSFRVVVVSQNPEARPAALAAGADAFLSKTAGPEQVLSVLGQIGVGVG